MTVVVVQRGEAQFASDTSAILAPMLTEAGFTVRVIDADEPPLRYSGDLFIAIGEDVSPSAQATGASVGYRTPQGKRLALLWKKHYLLSGWNRGFRADNYVPSLVHHYGVKMAVSTGNTAAFVSGSGFHTNSGDKVLMSPRRTANALFAAIMEYTGKDVDFLSAEDVRKIRKDIAELRSLIAGPNIDYKVSGTERKASLRTLAAHTRTETRATLVILKHLAEHVDAAQIAEAVSEHITRLDAADVVDELAERLDGASLDDDDED
jgi:hypothetical protein